MFLLFNVFLLLFVNLTFATEIEIKDYPILSEKRLELTKKYSKQHYDQDRYHLYKPKMIVIHYTAQHSLKAGLYTFKPATIFMDRPFLPRFGDLNVGVHFIINKKGDIYQLLPTTIMGRHVIGFNHTAIGIENVAFEEDELTKEQLNKNAKLVAFLKARHPSIQYLIGHLEYMNRSLPHYKLRIQKDKSYEPTIKIDPGWGFMKSLRKKLKEDYQIELKK